MSELLKKISDLTAGTPGENDIIPYVDLASNTTKKALKSELKGVQGDAATVDAGTTTTLAAGQSATVTNVGTTADAIFNFAIPQGIQGLTGANGACVVSVSFVGNDMVFVLEDASTITLTNAKTDLKGDTGAKIVSGAFVGDDLVFTLDDSSTATVTGAKTDLQGIQGIQGIPGETGNGISNISLISTVGLVKTYRITYTDDTTFDYTVTDGANGTGTLSSVVAGTNISIDNTDVNNPVINNTQDISGKENVSNKENTTLDTSTTKYPTNRLTKEYADGKVEDSITDGHTTVAPSGNAVFDALALKANTNNVLSLDNTTAFTPDADYEPATKKYVDDNAGGGASLWTAITGTRASNTTITVATDQTAIFKKGMIVRWQESGVDKVGIVSIPSTYSSPNTTITIIGDTCASIDTGTFKYSSLVGAEQFTKMFAIAGTIGATATNVANTITAMEPMRVIGADLWTGKDTPGTTNNTTVDINKNGTTIFTTKPTLATTVQSSPLPFTADTTSALALGDDLTLDIDAVQTTAAIDLYVMVYLFPERYLTLS